MVTTITAPNFQGALTALITPFRNDEIDETALRNLVEFQIAGGPALDTQLLKKHLLLYAGLMGLNWLLDVPDFLIRKFPDLADCASRKDARLSSLEAPRAQLQMMTVFLNLWQRADMGALIGAREAQSDAH